MTSVRTVRDHVVELAEQVSAGEDFWSVPVSAGEPITHVHIYAHRQAHWHYVTDGLSRSLGAMARGRASEIELSLRVPRTTESPLPQPIDLLRRVAATIAEGHVPAINDTAVYEPPLIPGTAISALAFVLDVALDPIEQPSGAIDILQCVGLTANEARACVRSSSLEVIERLRRADPYLVTRSDRPELDGLPTGSAMPVSRGHTVPTLRFDVDSDARGASLEIEPTRMRPTFIEHLLARVRGGTFFQVRGPERTLRVEPSDACRLEVSKEDGRDVLHVRVDTAALDAFERSARPEGDEPLTIGLARVTFVDEP